jgi:carbon-monoxide dehydrogenase medium subunit
MKPARFSYEAPATLEAALSSLAARGDVAKVIAGGQSLAPMMNLRIARPDHLIDINNIAGLNRVELVGDRVTIGALTRHADLARDPIVLAHCPLLAQAAGSIGNYTIRQRGTLGGSLAHADPAAQLPLIALTLDAEIELASIRGRRLVPADEFFLSVFTTTLAFDELIAAVRFPVAAGEGWGFRMLARRAGDFALVAVAGTIKRDRNGDISRLRLGASGLGAKPVRLDPLFSPPRMGTPGNLPAQIAQAVTAGVEIEDSERMPVEYRRELLAALTEDAVADALERAK